MGGPTGSPSPPAAGSVVGPAPQHPAWWQHWQVVLLLVFAAFSAGAASGMVAWMALQGNSEASVGAVADDRDLLRELLAEPTAPRQGVVEQDPTPTSLPDAELSVASDGCGVIRSDMEFEPRGLQWSVTDSEGFQVLGRNALNETRYRYFRPGTYTVELKAWDGEKYATISNTVTITC